MARTEVGADEAPPAAPPWLRAGLLAVLAAALVLRVAFLAAGGGDDDGYLISDARDYVQLGEDFVDAYTDDDHARYEKSLDRTPVYPLWLATIFSMSGRSLDAAAAGQLAVGVLTVLAVFLLGRRLFGPMAGLAAAALAAIDFTSVVWGSFLQPEALFTLLLLGFVYVWHVGVTDGPRWLLAPAGAILGAVVLTRPVGVFLPLLLAPLTWLAIPGDRLRRLAWTAVFVAVAAVPIGAWIARNEAATGVPFLSTVEGRNLLLYRAAGAVAEEDGRDVIDVRDELSEQRERRTPRGANAGRISREETMLGLEVLRDHPVGTVVSSVKGAGRLLFGPGQAAIARRLDRGDAESADTLVERGLVVLSLGSLVVIYGAAAVGVVALVRRRAWIGLALLVGLAAYFVLVPAGQEAYGRFRVPVMPFVALLGGFGVAVIAKDPDLRVP